MRRAPGPGVDPGVYAAAVPLLLRNPAIIVVPLLMAVVGVLVARVVAPTSGGIISGATAGLGSFLVILLELFGLGAACIIADEAWRTGSASFDRGWTEARRRGGEILFAALGMTLLFSVAQYVGAIVGAVVGLLLVALVAVFLIWTIPAAAVGGVPGSAAIQISIDRVRANPAAAALATVVMVALVVVAAPWAAFSITVWIVPFVGDFVLVVAGLISALLQAIALGYVALVLTKTYTDAAFTRRW